MGWWWFGRFGDEIWGIDLMVEMSWVVVDKCFDIGLKDREKKEVIVV